MESFGKNIQKFTRFLKEKGIYALYLREVKNNKDYSSSINMLFNGNLKAFLWHYDAKPWCLIDRSLCWRKTRNGRDFWEDIEHEWHNYLYRNR